MGEVVNLRLARKAKARAEQDAHAAENRIRHGQAKHERSLREALDRIDGKRLDAHKLTPEADGK